VIAAAGDEVSAAIASLFSSHGEAFQALSAQAAAFHAQFVQALNAGAGAYASTEAANAAPLQTLAQDLLDPNVAISVGGRTLEFGTATASSGPGSLAIAVGTNSSAEAGSFVTGKLDTAIALGAHSTADAVNGNFDLASVLGTFSTAFAGGTSSAVLGSGNVAFVWALPAPPAPAPASLLPAMATSPPSSATCSARRLPAPAAWSRS
jgi:PE family